MNNVFPKILNSISTPTISKEEWEKRKTNMLNAEVGTLSGYDCSLCKNKGTIYRFENGELKSKFCTCLEKRKKIRTSLESLEKSGLLELTKKYSFDNYETKEPWQEVTKKLALKFCKEQKNGWFYIGGQSGCGKTHLCTAIAYHFIQQGKSCKYFIWSEDGIQAKASLYNDSKMEAFINEIRNVDVLYIDDFLKVSDNDKPTATDMKLAFIILNCRYNLQNKITIISSEFFLDALKSYDAATHGRIRERVMPYLIEIKADNDRNYRLRNEG